MGYGSAETGELNRVKYPLPADLIEQPGEAAGWQPSLPGIPRPDRQTTFAAAALGLSLINIAGGAHLPGVGAESHEPGRVDAATTSLVVESGTASSPNQSTAATRPHLTTIHIHKGQTFWGLENEDGLPHGTLEELNPEYTPTAIPVGAPIKTMSTGAVHEIATQHRESNPAAAFEGVIAADGGRTWHNGPQAPLPKRGDAALLHEPGSGYYDAVINSVHTDQAGRHFAEVEVIETGQHLMIPVANTQRVLEFGSFTPAPSHAANHALQAREASTPSASAAAATASPSSAASSRASTSPAASASHVQTGHRNTPAPSATASIAAQSPPAEITEPGVRPQASAAPSASALPSPATSPSLGTQGEPISAATLAPKDAIAPSGAASSLVPAASNETATPGKAVAPDLDELLNHPATLSSIETHGPGAKVAHFVLDSYIDAPGASPTPGPSTGETASPVPSGSTAPTAAATSSPSAEATGGDNAAVAVAPNFDWLGSSTAGSQDTKPGDAKIPGVPSGQSASPQTASSGRPAASSNSNAATGQERRPSGEYSQEEQRQIRAKITANGYMLNAKYGGQAEPAVIQSFSQHGPEPWCADLVEYLRHISGAPTFDGTALDWPADDNPQVAGTNNSIEATAAAKHELWTFTPGGRLPEPGDNVVFGDPGYHIETVLERHGDTIITLGGDTLPATADGQLAMRIHKFNLSSHNNDIAAFVSLFPPSKSHAAGTPRSSGHASTSSSPSATASPQAGSSGQTGQAAIPGAVAVNLSNFAAFSPQSSTGANPNTSTNSGVSATTGQAAIPGAVSPDYSWLGGGDTASSPPNGNSGSTAHNKSQPSPAPSQPSSEIVVPKRVAPADMTPFAKPSITEQHFAQVLHNAGSPAYSSASGLYKASIQGGIDPAFMLAFFMHESSFGTQGEAVKTLSIGNSRCYSGAACVDQDRGGYASYSSWVEGARAWTDNLNGSYYKGAGNTTLGTIIPVYAPPTDNNNDNAYIDGVGHAVQYWQAGNTGVPSY